MAATLPAVDLDRLASDARAGGRLGLDTEFMTEGRYHALLCLVQVSVDDPAAPAGVRVELIDPLARTGDPAPLAAVLADRTVDVVLHAARQDVAILRRVWDTEISGVWDTQIAAGFAGFAAQAGYVNLLGEALGVRLPKSASFTRWDVRPLTSEQLEYARGDVLYLLALADRLRERLRETGREGWVRDECAALERVSDTRDPGEAWRRLPKATNLPAGARTVARELAAWREETAQVEDRPVASVLADAALVEIARRRPASASELGTIRGVHGGVLRRRGEDVLRAVARGAAKPPMAREPESGPGLTARDAPLVSLAEAFLRQRALEEGLAYEVLATRADLNRVVGAARHGRDSDGTRVLEGWRREVAGEELLELLAGRRSLTVAPGGLEVGSTSPPSR